MKVIVVRSGSAILFSEFGQKPVSAGDVVVLSANVLCGSEPEGHITVTTVYVGYRIGTSKGREVWASVEDSILLIGPPRSGKGLHIVIPAILDAPGAVVTTSTRPDNLLSLIHILKKKYTSPNPRDRIIYL
ncbi:type IV secretory system conjugative DNA transfer family protein, partial [Microbacterium sp. AR7-10]|uniref:type IV secretory system conjugative DNA transfer family protein n=1 Tax=Microbacterium sp. AR7-10 TaxID=1891970 RepID=UPI00210C6D22